MIAPPSSAPMLPSPAKFSHTHFYRFLPPGARYPFLSCSSNATIQPTGLRRALVNPEASLPEKTRMGLKGGVR